jgi:predicted DCC family thiol-disulfide oxidoreductase YuxK
MKTESGVILFDGLCNLCNGFVQFVIARDPESCFKFASLQSDIARTLLKDLPAATQSLDSVVLIQNGRIYQRSTAALRILRQLSGGWPLCYGTIILPAFFRDWVYDIVAKNRYRWLGHRESCLLPTPALKSRFL